MAEPLAKRRSNRLPSFDYAAPTGYFVTICTQNRDLLFGDVRQGEMHASPSGKIVLACWEAIPRHFPHADLDEFVVMPNHVHGVLVLSDAQGAGAACRAPTSALPRTFGPPDRTSLSTIVRSFKSAATREINRYRDTPGAAVWQRNFYEHVIRNPDELLEIARYIQENPLRWHEDEENPARTWAPAALQ